MQRKPRLSATPSTRGAVALAILIGLGAMLPAQAADAPMQASAVAAPAADQKVEARIKDLHTRLDITTAQEDSWNKVAQVMRENAGTMSALTEARAGKATTMTAVEDLKSYAEIAEAHADGIQKFTPVFSALYDSMSDSQKKNADAIFRAHGDKAMKHATAKAG